MGKIKVIIIWRHRVKSLKRKKKRKVHGKGNRVCCLQSGDRERRSRRDQDQKIWLVKRRPSMEVTRSHGTLFQKWGRRKIWTVEREGIRQKMRRVEGRLERKEGGPGRGEKDLDQGRRGMEVRERK